MGGRFRKRFVVDGRDKKNNTYGCGEIKVVFICAIRAFGPNFLYIFCPLS